jgi:hypothetical protein
MASLNARMLHEAETQGEKRSWLIQVKITFNDA